MGLLKFDALEAKRLSDLEIVKRVLSGEKELFEILMRRHNQTLFRIIHGYVTSEQDVMDIMQESYLKAYYKLDTFRVESQFSTWLISITINEALQWLRSAKKNRDIKTQHSAGNTQVSTPESRIIYRETSYILEQAVIRIPVKYRAVFIMAEIEQLPQKEIAEILSITRNNVKVRLHRAKTLIKDEMFAISSDRSILEFGNEKCDRVVEAVMHRF